MTEQVYRIKRRSLLTAGLVVGLSAMPVISMASTLIQPESEQGFRDFFEFSQFATGHAGLDKGVGQALYQALQEQDSEFVQKLALLQAKKGNLPDVDALADALEGHPLRATLLLIIRGWYSGVIEEGTNAKVYAFEKALMYQPAGDVVVIPTYAHNGPNYWTAEPPAVDQLPPFFFEGRA